MVPWIIDSGTRIYDLGTQIIESSAGFYDFGAQIIDSKNHARAPLWQKVRECCSKTGIWELSHGSAGSRGNGGRSRCSDPPFHARRGPGLRELSGRPCSQVCKLTCLGVTPPPTVQVENHLCAACHPPPPRLQVQVLRSVLKTAPTVAPTCSGRRSRSGARNSRGNTTVESRGCESTSIASIQVFKFSKIQHFKIA